LESDQDPNMQLSPVQKFILEHHGCFVSTTGIIWYGYALSTHCTIWTKTGRVRIAGTDLLQFTNWNNVKRTDNDQSFHRRDQSLCQMPFLNYWSSSYRDYCGVGDITVPVSCLESLVNYSLNCYEFDPSRRKSEILREASRLIDTSLYQAAVVVGATMIVGVLVSIAIIFIIDMIKQV
jgi:hypothetical protein